MYRGERTRREYPASGYIGNVVFDAGKRDWKTRWVQAPAARIRFVHLIADSVFVSRLSIFTAVIVPVESVMTDVALHGWWSFTPRKRLLSSRNCDRRTGSLVSSVSLLQYQVGHTTEQRYPLH